MSRACCEKGGIALPSIVSIARGAQAAEAEVGDRTKQLKRFSVELG